MAPLFYRFPGGRLYYGVAIQANTEAAGAPMPDSYVYVYGRYRVWMKGAPVYLVVARVQPRDFQDFAAWRFWDGAGWSEKISDSKPLGIGGAELSVTPMTALGYRGKYLLIAMRPKGAIFYRLGASPYGPFGPARELYKPREFERGTGIYTYNAKAHPHLSEDRRLLVSYNVNTTVRKLNRRNGSLYRPRFLWLELAE